MSSPADLPVYGLRRGKNPHLVLVTVPPDNCFRFGQPLIPGHAASCRVPWWPPPTRRLSPGSLSRVLVAFRVRPGSFTILPLPFRGPIAGLSSWEYMSQPHRQEYRIRPYSL